MADDSGAESSKKKKPTSSKSVSFAMETDAEDEVSNSTSNRSGPFSNGTRNKAKEYTNGRCWVCTMRNAEVAYVISKEDPQKDLWLGNSLINFSLTSIDNAIPLCGGCHNDFDKWIDLQWIFLPEDLQFFINWELNDRQSRDTHTDRSVPSADDYKKHQVAQGKVESTAIGGNYVIIHLGAELFSDGRQSSTGPKPWHGAPVASLRRGIHVLGSPRIESVLTATQIKQLKMLKDLYFGSVAPVNSGQAVSADKPGPSGSATGEKRGRHGDKDGDSKGKKRKTSEKEKERSETITSRDYNLRNRDRPVPGKVWCPGFKYWVKPSWEFGPQTTAQDIIKRRLGQV